LFKANITGSWKGTNARGVGFGRFFNKPIVDIAIVENGLKIDDKTFIFKNVHPEPNPNGGFWCAFTIDEFPARLAFASNGWWILEFGAIKEKNKTRLTRK
jgi:hypothetical protein